MYTEQNRGFTIITNFGCDCNCKYCITKHHPILQNAITDKSKIDWVYLEKCISESNAPTVNLSGGGDPFYNWQKNIDGMQFYVKVKIVQENGEDILKCLAFHEDDFA